MLAVGSRWSACTSRKEPRSSPQPALGWSDVVKNLRAAMFDSLDALAAEKVPGSGERRIDYGVVHEQDSEMGRSVYIASPWWRPGRLRLVLGTDADERATLSGDEDVGCPGSGRGDGGLRHLLFIDLGDGLCRPRWRLSVIAVSVIMTMVLWLLVGNRLWERSRQVGSPREAAMYNASTVATLFVAVAALYAVLFVGILARRARSSSRRASCPRRSASKCRCGTMSTSRG